ncbi:MAG: hypothetical protein Q7R65_02155 [bacterium]|nr:hypothetical protein [bacterium]
MHEDIKWLFGVIILFAVLWFAAGGLNSPASQSPFLEPGVQSGGYNANPNFAHIGNNSSDIPYYGTQGTQTAGRKLTTREEIEQGLIYAGIKANEIKKELDALEQASRASPLSGMLAIAGMSRGSGTAMGEYIVLRASPQNTQKILITGLRLQSSASGNGIDIPKGVPLPFQNQINREDPVFLGAGETAYIITGRSPLGYSFRLNKCTGFFNQYQTFNPGLPGRCPQPREQDLPIGSTIYNDACRDYINSLPSCRVILNPPLSISPECQRYVTTEINYTKCVDNHKNDSDFYDPLWQIYIGRDDALWKTRRELIYLLDQNGKVIDAVTY